MNQIEHTRVFVDQDRQMAAMLLREHLCELLEAPKKDYVAIKTVYTLILEEEAQDLNRRKVEISERQDLREAQSHEAAAKPEKKALPASEIKHRIRVLLGKETP